MTHSDTESVAAFCTLSLYLLSYNSIAGINNHKLQQQTAGCNKRLCGTTWCMV